MRVDTLYNVAMRSIRIVPILLAIALHAHAQAPTLSGVIERGRMLVPARGVFEQMGASVKWYAPTRTVTLVREGRTAVLQVDYPAALVNGHLKTLSVPARLIEGQVYLPLRFAAETLGLRVDYAAGVALLRHSGGAIVRVRVAGGG